MPSLASVSVSTALTNRWSGALLTKSAATITASAEASGMSLVASAPSAGLRDNAEIAEAGGGDLGHELGLIVLEYSYLGVESLDLCRAVDRPRHGFGTSMAPFVDLIDDRVHQGQEMSPRNIEQRHSNQRRQAAIFCVNQRHGIGERILIIWLVVEYKGYRHVPDSHRPCLPCCLQKMSAPVADLCYVNWVGRQLSYFK
jgi:hypothetical protein